MKAIVFGSIAINLIFSMSLSLVWSMVNTLQLIVHLPLFSIMHPSNALIFYTLLIGVTNFSLVDVSGVQVKMLQPEDVEADSSHTLNFELMGYESRNAVLNLESMFFYLLGGVAMIFVSIGARMIFRCSTWC